MEVEDDIETILNGKHEDKDIEIIEIDDKPDDDDQMSIDSASTIKIVRNNPVEEHLNKQLNCVQNQINYINNNIEVLKNITDNTLKTIANQSVYKEDSSSESDNELYTSTGEPVIKKSKSQFYEKSQVINVNKVWQRVINDKWIIGVDLESTTTCLLQDPTIYVHQKDGQDACYGQSTFWSLVENKFWFPTDEIESNEKLVATAVLDLPLFDSATQIEAYGTIFCEFGGKLFQTPLPKILLSLNDVINGSLTINFDEKNEAIISLLSLKVMAIDRIVFIPASENPLAQRIVKFFLKYEFEEICNVCISNSSGLLKYCILEILPADDGDLQVFISATCEAQLSAMIQLMKNDFPELVDPEKQQTVDEAAEALRKELKLYLTCDEPAKIQRARVVTDLLIP